MLSNWQFGDTYSRVRSMDIRNAPKGTQVSLSCTGCALKKTKRLTVARDLAPLHLKRYLGTAKLKKGASITVSVVADRPRRAHLHLQGRPLRRVPGAVDRVYHPGAKEGRPC